jgi:enoyl-CoA hydratase/carnithine racemase
VGYDLPPELRVTVDGPVRLLTLNRPDALNACNERMHEALADVWGQINDDADARAVVLTGAGRAFSAGGDLDWIREDSRDDEGARRSTARAQRIIEEVLRCRVPVVAAVNGPAVGMGCSLTVLSDLVLMAPDAFLADPHVGVGLVAGDGGVVWPFLTGMHVAKEFLFLGTRMSANDAVRTGLANRVVPADDLVPEATRIAHQLAGMPARALEDTKRALNSLVFAHWPSVQFGVAAEQASMRSGEHRERLAQIRTPKGEEPRGDAR